MVLPSLTVNSEREVARQYAKVLLRIFNLLRVESRKQEPSLSAIDEIVISLWLDWLTAPKKTDAVRGAGQISSLSHGVWVEIRSILEGNAISQISPHQFGMILEEYLSCRSAADMGVQRENHKSHKLRRDSGAYYTPRDVAKFIVQKSLEKQFSKAFLEFRRAVRNAAWGEIGTLLESAISIRVLDPACGGGIFLLEALEFLARRYGDLLDILKSVPLARLSKQDRLLVVHHRRVLEFPARYALANNLFGVDLNPLAIKVCVFALHWHASALDSGSVQVGSVESPQFRVGNSWAVCGEGVQCGEAEDHFCLPKEFPAVFEASDPGFDVVLANPPYARLSAEHVRLANRLNLHSGRWGNAYSLFVETLPRYLRNSSFSCGIVIPLSFSFSGRYAELRQAVLSGRRQAEFFHFDNMPDSLFVAGKSDSENTNRANSQRTTVMFLSDSKLPVVRSSDLIRWRSVERKDLFRVVPLADVTTLFDAAGAIPKAGDARLVSFLIALRKKGAPIKSLLNSKGNHIVSMPSVARYFISALPDSHPAKGRWSLTFNSKENALICAGVLNSNVFYWYWRCFGDGFHVTKELACSFPLPPEILSGPRRQLFLDSTRSVIASARRCGVSKLNSGKIVVNVNFNHAMDRLHNLDRHILGAAENDDLAPEDFSKFKVGSDLGRYQR